MDGGMDIIFVCNYLFFIVRLGLFSIRVGDLGMLCFYFLCFVSCKLIFYRSFGFLLIFEAGVEYYWGYKD